jgi:hypothetical protein
MQPRRYELFYGSGGHGGPYDYDYAVARAKSLVNAGERKVTISIYDAEAPGGYRPVQLVTKVTPEPVIEVIDL